jgi:hypothetical protein
MIVIRLVLGPYKLLFPKPFEEAQDVRRPLGYRNHIFGSDQNHKEPEMINLHNPSQGHFLINL